MTVVPPQHHAPADDHDTPPGVYDRMPPQDTAAEQSVLGSMILSRDAVLDVQDVLQADDYYRPAHGTIHTAILAMTTRNDPVDPITLESELRKLGNLERVGGTSYLHTLILSVPTAANADYYAHIVRERAVLRRLVEAGTRIVQAGYAGQGDVDDIFAQAGADLAAVAEGRDRDDDFTTPRQSLEGTLDAIDRAQHGTGITGTPTGFADLDKLTSGLQPGQMIVIAGRPGTGKSTLAMDMARSCAVQHSVPAVFISLEMSVDELNMRMLSAEGKILLHRLRSGGMGDDDWTRLAKTVPRLTEAPLHVNDSSRNWNDIQAKIRRLKARTPNLGLVVIDYMQLINLGGRRPDVREREVAEISRGVKLLAKELHVPIVALAQLNRGPEMRTDKKPQASDLRESGSQEQDADIIILLHREDAYEAESPRAGEMDLIVAKHRNGPTATLTVASQLHYSRFVDMATGV